MKSLYQLISLAELHHGVERELSLNLGDDRGQAAAA